MTWNRLSRYMSPAPSWPALTDLCREQTPFENDIVARSPGARPSTSQTLSVNRAGNLAMLHGKWILHDTGPNGRQVRREGRNTETAREQPDGRWLFVIDNPAVPQD